MEQVLNAIAQTEVLLTGAAWGDRRKHPTHLQQAVCQLRHIIRKTRPILSKEEKIEQLTIALEDQLCRLGKDNSPSMKSQFTQTGLAWTYAVSVILRSTND